MTLLERSEDFSASDLSASEEPHGSDVRKQDIGIERCCIVPYKLQPHKRRREIILPTNASGYVHPIRAIEQQNLLRAIAQARSWLHEIIEGHGVTSGTIAVRERKSERSIRMTLSLAFLDPRLAVGGSLPRGFNAKRLTELPMLWPKQWEALGLPQPG